MKSSLKISSAILLMAIFFITNPAPASADFLGLPSKYDYMAKNGYFSEAQLDDSCDLSAFSFSIPILRRLKKLRLTRRRWRKRTLILQKK